MSFHKELQPDNWFIREQRENHAIVSAWWHKHVLQNDIIAIDNLKELLINFHAPKAETNLIFSALANKQPSIEFDNFYKFVTKYLPSAFIWGIDSQEHFGITLDKDIPRNITPHDMSNIECYMKDAGITGTFNIGCMNADGNMHSPNNQPTVPYAIHSVGKVLTGMLVLKLLEKGIIQQESIDQPIKGLISKPAWQSLPESVRKHLDENDITLRQVMTHKGGLGDYLPRYTKEIEEGKRTAIDQPEDFIPYVDTAVSKDKIGKDHYSNVGILLVGLAIKHACNDQDYNKILQKHLLDEAGVTCTSHRPNNGVYNLNNNIDLHVVGGPSGGYWMTVEDLGKFGKWMYEQHKNPNFEKLMREYGQEFYYPQFGKIAHDGRTPSANAHFAIYLESGIIITALSNQPDTAVELGFAIKRHLFSRPQLESDLKLGTTAKIATQLGTEPRDLLSKPVDDDAAQHTEKHIKAEDAFVKDTSKSDKDVKNDPDTNVGFTRKY